LIKANDEETLPVSVKATAYQRTLLKKGINGDNPVVKKHGRSKLPLFNNQSVDILSSLADFKNFHHIYTEKELYEIFNREKLVETPSSLQSDEFNYNVKKGLRFNV
jgi:glutaredoxin-related protein